MPHFRATETQVLSPGSTWGMYTWQYSVPPAVDDALLPDWLAIYNNASTAFSPHATDGFQITQEGLYLVTAVVACSAFTVGNLAAPLNLKTRNVLRWETHLT